MASTVTQAFDEFLRDSVKLDSNEVSSARASRDWLKTQILRFPGNDSEFPSLFSENNIDYGSFSRKTKKRPLDDVDTMTCFSAEGAYYTESSVPITITVPDSATNLKKLCFENSNTLSSVKVINKLVANLKTVSQYEYADIKRNQVAATLKLKSYPWTFDVVPSFFTVADYRERTYYLIPDGQGHWQKTDPRMDRSRVQSVNQQHEGNVLNVVRTLKYWNKRKTMPSAKSYVFENLVLDFYDSPFTPTASNYVDVEILKALRHIADNIYHPVNDPKNIQGDLNDLSYDERNRISERARADEYKACEARNLEDAGNHRAAIAKWREIFGSEFPSYG